jgi:hypothetical protein
MESLLFEILRIVKGALTALWDRAGVCSWGIPVYSPAIPKTDRTRRVRIVHAAWNGLLLWLEKIVYLVKFLCALCAMYFFGRRVAKCQHFAK